MPYPFWKDYGRGLFALRAGAVPPDGRALRFPAAFVLRLFVVVLGRLVFAAPVLRFVAGVALGVAPVLRFEESGVLLFVRVFVLRGASGRSSALRLLAFGRLLVVKLAFKFELMLPFAVAFEFALLALAFLLVFLLRFGRFAFSLAFSFLLLAEADSF